METNTILLYVSLIVNVLLVVFFIRTELRLKKLLRGKTAENLEHTIGSLIESVNFIAEKEKALRVHAKEMDARIKKSIRNIETIRFNPFEDSGSNQSFAVSLVNDEGHGVVISSLYSRDRVSVFAKPVTAGTSTYELSDEEKSVLKKSLN